MKRALSLLTTALLAPALSSPAIAAPIPITFWHSMEGVSSTVERYAAEFNRSQSQYEIRPTAAGNYREAAGKLQEAIRAGNPPVLFQAEFTTFSALAGAGQLIPLDGAAASLPPELIRDLYPAVWRAGEVGGVRYGLPWNVSTPVLFYNAAALRKAGVGVPKTWTELESAAARLKTGGRRPLVAVADAWTFEGLVAARGGQLVENGRPTFTSPAAVAALEQLARMVKAGTAQPRTLAEAVPAAFDFARGQNVMVVGSVANWTDFAKLPFLELGAAPFPCEKVCAVPLGGANLAVVKGAGPQQTAGALAFWKFLMDPARLADWVKVSAYVTPRRSVQAALGDYYASNPYRKAAYDQLDNAAPRPAAPQYAAWQPLLEEAIGKAMRGQLSAAAALAEAQRRAQPQ